MRVVTQAIIKVGDPGVLPRKILQKMMLAGAFWFILRVNNYDCELSKLPKNMKTMHTTSHLQSHLHMLHRYRDDHYHIHTNRICERDDHYRISAKKWFGFGLTYRTGSAGPVRGVTAFKLVFNFAVQNINILQGDKAE